MKLNKFTLLFWKDHFIQTFVAYIFLLISCLAIWLSPQLKDFENLQKIIDGLSISYIAAFIFYYLINLFPEYTRQKQGIITIKNELNNIAMNIRDILSIFKSFSSDNCYKVNLPNSIIYVKEKDSEWKNFFNPREELSRYVYALHKELNNIKMKYCVLPINLIIILNEIEKLDIGQKLKFLYDALDKGYETTIHGYPECITEIEELLSNLEQYGINHRDIKIYQIMIEQEIKEYKEEINSIRSQIDCTLYNGRLYRGGTRIL